MSNSAQAFFNRSRTADNLASEFAQVEASKLGGLSLLRRTDGGTFASGVEQLTPLRRTDAGVFASHVESLAILRSTVLVTLTGTVVTDSGARGAIASWGVVGSSIYQTEPTGLFREQYTWLQSGIASDYEMRSTYFAGDVPDNSPQGVWIDMSTGPRWDVAVGGRAKNETAIMVIEIRDTATSTIQANVFVTLQAYTDGGEPISP